MRFVSRTARAMFGDRRFQAAEAAQATLVHALMRACFRATSAQLEGVPPSSALLESVADVASSIALGGAVLLRSDSRWIGGARWRCAGDALEIARLGVLADARGGGHGAALVDYLAGHARQLGCVALRADARSRGPDNRGWWQHLGFEVVGHSARYGIAGLRTHLRRPL